MGFNSGLKVLSKEFPAENHKFKQTMGTGTLL